MTARRWKVTCVDTLIADAAKLDQFFDVVADTLAVDHYRAPRAEPDVVLFFMSVVCFLMSSCLHDRSLVDMFDPDRQ
jgi:hypothetical protein